MKKQKIASHNVHGHYLEELINRGLSDIGLDRKDIEFIFKEPVCYAYGSCRQQSMCDLLIFMQNMKAYPLELKGTLEKRSKAIDQLSYGKRLIERRFPDYDPSKGLFVVYRKGHEHYLSEWIDL